MRIDVLFDTTCPWCFLGKRRLELTLKQKPEIKPLIIWNPFEINPEIPSQGISRDEYLRLKFKNHDHSDQTEKLLGKVGKSVGINFRFRLIKRTPNTHASHKFVQFARRCKRDGDVVEKLFRAYFIEGMDIGDQSNIFYLARTMGFDEKTLKVYLQTDQSEFDNIKSDMYLYNRGINGIPAFIVDQKFSISGAHEPRILCRLIEVAQENQTDMYNLGIQSI